jgi:hypothetical protein
MPDSISLKAGQYNAIMACTACYWHYLIVVMLCAFSFATSLLGSDVSDYWTELKLRVVVAAIRDLHCQLC